MAEIERQFTGSERTTALKTLNLFTGKPGEREQAQLAILAQSGGRLETLRTLVDSAKRSPGDGADARVAQATAIAQLQGARHVPGQDAVAPVGSSKEYPPYRYIFYVAIGIIPVLTLGGAVRAGRRRRLPALPGVMQALGTRSGGDRAGGGDLESVGRRGAGGRVA